MPFDLTPLIQGCLYTRPELQRLWEYRDYRAFARGVFTPQGANAIVLFVTRQKQRGFTAYKDYINGDLLHWEGEKSHANDRRIARAAEYGEAIYLFYRDIHHTPFRYYGQILLTRFVERKDVPSSFIFELVHNMSAIDDIVVHQQELSELSTTERQQVTKARIGQGKFRESLLKLWRGCAITGVAQADLVRASHIKPWRLSSNSERLDPYNGLLLLPQYDHLFDEGYISFDDDGQIIRSPAIEHIPTATLGIEKSAKLRKMNDNHRTFLDFHRKLMFLRRTAKN